MSNLSGYVPTIVDIRQATDDYLREFVADRTGQAHKLSPHYGALWATISDVLLAGGKRLRPYMVMLAYAAFAKEPHPDDVLPAAVSTELLHTALLIHDDIIDRDSMRHGVLNVSGQFEERYKSLIDGAAERRHFADSAAILAGDLLISSAHYLLARKTACPPEVTARIVAYLDQAMFAVCGGELLDTESAFRGDDRANAMTIAHAKTASYSFEIPLAIGAALGEATDEDIAQLSRGYGTVLGQAFQFQDDVLGVFGNEDVTGKSTIGDIREGKRTFLVEQFFKLASVEQRNIFEQAFGRPDAHTDEYQAAKDALRSSGAVEAAQARIDDLTSKARRALAALNLSSQYHEAFEELITRCVKREQ